MLHRFFIVLNHFIVKNNVFLIFQVWKRKVVSSLSPTNWILRLINRIIGQLTLFNVCCSFFRFSSDFFPQLRTHFHRTKCRFLQDADVVVVIRSLELQVNGQTNSRLSGVLMKMSNLHEKYEISIEKWTANTKES